MAGLLGAYGIESTFVGITTRGDVDRRALAEIGGTGVFAAAVRDALRADRIDVAVHSLKDLPTADDPGLEVVAVPQREDTRDVLIGLRLADLTDGARIGTGAPRRALQLHELAKRTGTSLQVVPVRGNVGTRLDLVQRGEVDAVVLAAAGLVRLGLLAASDLVASQVLVRGVAAEVLDHEVMLPAPGQGALALEIHRSLSNRARAVVETLDDPISHAECLVERGFLATLEAGCTAPVGARATVKSVRDSGLDLTLNAVIGRTLLSTLSQPSPDGGGPLRTRMQGSSRDPRQFGSDAAHRALSELQNPQRTLRREAGEA